MIREDIELNDGTVAWIDEYFVRPTYEGVEGDDCSDEGNQMMLDQVSQTASRIWNDFPTRFLFPSSFHFRSRAHSQLGRNRRRCLWLPSCGYLDAASRVSGRPKDTSDGRLKRYQL
jgi:hypothetical protein